MKVLCILLLGCLAAHANGQTFPSPGMDWSLIIPGWNPFTFGDTQKQTLCNYITASWTALGQGGVPVCSVGSVGTSNGTSALVSGNAYFTWPNGTPNVVQLNAASAARDATVNQLTTNTNAVVGTVFPGTTANCACNGISLVTQSSTTAYSYQSVITGVPGPMLCGARLTYNSFDQNAVYNQVGIDDGSTSGNVNLGKYCSSPAVNGGVNGIPGQGSCRVYGVITSAAGGNEALVTANGITMGSFSNRGSIQNVVPAYPGSGFTSVPVVTSSAPDPLPVSAIYTLDSNAQPSGLNSATTTGILTPSNGPYIGDNIQAISLTDVCVDAGALPPNFDPNAAICTGPQKTIQVRINSQFVTVTGYTCTVNDFNVVNNGPPLTGKCGANVFGGKKPCTTVNENGVVTYVGFPGSANVYCAGIPIVTFSNAALQTAVRATLTATITNGQVTAIPVISGGSGYRTVPHIIVAPPSSNSYGKLCSPSPIFNLSPAISYSTPVAMSMTGECQPFGRNTQTNNVCATPSPPNGEWIPLDTATCNVQSSFTPQPGSSTFKDCGILPQSFVLNGTPNPPPPPAQSPPVPSPSPTPQPSPSPNPSPSPDPTPDRCVYDGVYRIQNVACPQYYLSYSVGSKSCQDYNIYFKTTNQAKSPRQNWRISTIAVDGKATPASGIAAVGRLDSCDNDNINLGAVSGAVTPKLASSGWKIRINPINFNRCSNVRLQAATGNGNNGKYLAVNGCNPKASNFAFSWKPYSNSDTKMQWKLVYKSSK